MKPTILMVSERVPFPADNGGKLRTANTLKHLSKYYTIDFVMYSIDTVSEKQLEQVQRYCRKIMVFPEGIPSKRKHLRHFITGKSGIACCIYSKSMQAAIDQLLAENQYHFLWVERLFCLPYFNRRLKKNGNNPPVILNMHDVDHEAVQFFSQVDLSYLKRMYYREEYKRVLRLEEYAIRSVHRIIAVSERDRKLYQEKFPFCTDKWFSANNGVDLSVARNAQHKERAKSKVLFVGGLDNPCNRHGILWFVKEVWEKILVACPDAQLDIAGSGKSTTKLKEELCSSPHVNFLGYVDDVNELYQKATCIIVPLLSGSGTRLKIVEAFSFKLPVVSTSIGAEGLPVENGRELIIADNADSFAKGVIKAIQDNGCCNLMTEEAYNIAVKYYDWDVIMDNLIKKVEASL
ncbi:glycosyltransferase family 4 protein [Desulfosporosinus sp. SYSU MS00001]|uniref:glycosyltransferase family 4 protein n=1 Tax=Desulfosporosinus sp. SYSU MS00001 TaxID=3416284 RepID=UPI003CF7AD06